MKVVSNDDSIRQALNRLRSFFRKEPLDREVEAEMASHLELAIEENVRRGLPRKKRAAKRWSNSAEWRRRKERHREARGLPALDILTQDLRYTFRTLAARPCVHDCSPF